MIDVALPCLNEAQALPSVLSRIPDGFRPIVVDNGSTDDSVDVARAHGARVVHASPHGSIAATVPELVAAWLWQRRTTTHMTDARPPVSEPVAGMPNGACSA